MPVITLTTDWGLKDPYAGAVKGSLLRLCPEASVVDISHNVPLFDIIQASYILRNTYRDFPEGTVHIVEVKAHADEHPTHIVIQAEGQYFIGPDNGIFPLVLDKKIEHIFELSTNNYYSPFPTKDIYVKAASHLAKGGQAAILGAPKEKIIEKMLFKPTLEPASIRGSVIFVDDFGNLITNISRELFEEIAQDRPFTLFLRRFEYEITQLHRHYAEVPEGEKLALFNNAGLLEIAINHGKASTLLGMSFNDSIRIEFNDHKNSANDLHAWKGRNLSGGI